jgi:predicted amidohydrolase YtcJ
MEEAIEAYTWGSAVAEGKEAEKGSLEAGKLADVVIFDGDPIIVSEREIRKINPVLTILGGRIIHDVVR